MTVYQALSSGLETQWLKRQKTCPQSSTQSTEDRPKTTATTTDHTTREVLPEKRAKPRGWKAGKRGLWPFVRKDLQELQMPYLAGSEDTPVSPRSSFPLTPARKWEQRPDLSTQLSVVLTEHQKALYLKTEEPFFPFSQSVGWWKHGSWAYQCLYLTAEKVVACESLRFSCVPRSVGGEASGGQHWLQAPVGSSWGRKDAGAPGEQCSPPTSLKCAYPQCYHQARPQNSVRAKSTLSKKKKTNTKGTNKLSFCHPPPLCAAEENQMK